VKVKRCSRRNSDAQQNLKAIYKVNSRSEDVLKESTLNREAIERYAAWLRNLPGLYLFYLF
jgi:hypothetical protein